MKAIVSLIGLSMALATSHALAKDYVLLDTDKAPTKLEDHQPGTRFKNR